jgi:hypothetical protein
MASEGMQLGSGAWKGLHEVRTPGLWNTCSRACKHDHVATACAATPLHADMGCLVQGAGMPTPECWLDRGKGSNVLSLFMYLQRSPCTICLQHQLQLLSHLGLRMPWELPGLGISMFVAICWHRSLHCALRERHPARCIRQTTSQWLISVAPTISGRI